MAHQTVPADIAAAIDELVHRAEWGTCQVGDSGQEEARAALNAAILHHLRAYDEMKAALEAQTSGGA